MSNTVVLHPSLRCKASDGEELIAFLRGAVPFYESLSGVRIRLLQSADRPNQFIEVVEYEAEEASRADEHRLAVDPEMQSFVERWRELLVEPPVVERFSEVTNRLH